MENTPLEHTTQREQGLTLIELSIVLVIIGLLVGAIMLGAEMVTTSEVRRDLKSIEEFSLTFNTFRSKYGCRPGDCANASTFFSGTFNGNGNDQIDPTFNSVSVLCAAFPANIATEVSAMNAHLSLSRLVPRESYDPAIYLNCSRGKVITTVTYGSGFCAYTERYPAVPTIRLGCTNGGSEYIGFGSAPRLTPAIAAMFDRKLDDGKPRSGKILGAVYQVASSGPQYWYAGCTQLVNGTYEYRSGNTTMDTNNDGTNRGCPMLLQNMY